MPETLLRPGQLVDPVTAMDIVFRDDSGSVVNDDSTGTRLAVHQRLEKLGRTRRRARPPVRRVWSR
jgi:hypothetical protein